MSWKLQDAKNCPFPARLWITISPADRSRSMSESIDTQYKSLLVRYFRKKKIHGQSFASKDKRTEHPGIHDVLHSEHDLDPEELKEFFDNSSLRGANIWIQKYSGNEDVYLYVLDPLKHESFPTYLYCPGRGRCRYKRSYGPVRSCVHRRMMF